MKKNILTVAIALLLSAGASAQTTTTNSPFVVPTLHNWTAAKTQTISVKERITNISIANETLRPAAELLQQALKAAGVNVSINVEKKAGDKAVRLDIIKNKKLGNEGYTLDINEKAISMKAQTAQGIVWSVQTLAQMLEQNASTLLCGSTTDVPEYKLRGFMIDCGRKNIPMDYLRRLVRCMSHYKMNTLQVHLNDNGFKKYFHNNWDETYAAFRLESEVFPELTARDGYYTKNEFREFIKWAATLGVEIIPEIDAPAHALAFTHFRPQYANPAFGIDHLDLTNPEVKPFLDSLYNEYLDGPDPVFAGPRVHIGTDEFNNSTEEARETFRDFTQHFIKLVKNHKKQPVIWGSLTWAPGKTHIDTEGVLMDCWSNGFAQPDSMKQLGYQLVSIPDGWVYIVPAAGYYYDYLYDSMLYEKWTPANINGKQFAEHDPQIEGGMFAVWNDVCGNGISTFDIHHRTMPAMQVIAQKCWSSTASTMTYDEWDKLRKPLNDEVAHTWGRLPQQEVRIPSIKPNTMTAGLCKQLDGVTDLGYDYSISFDVVAAKEKRGACLFKSDFAEFFLADPTTGCIGFIRDGYQFNFDYSLRQNEKCNIRIEGTNKATSLYINGKLFQTLGYNEVIAADKKPYNIVRTLAFPIETTGNYSSKVSNIVIKKL